MTFTYTPSAVNDVTRVRYHLRDTDEATAMFTDEEIEMAISEEGSYQKAVISLIQATIAELSREPDMSADWLKIDWRRSVASWSTMLSEKKKAFNLGFRISASSHHTYRADSLLKSEPDYDEE